MNNYLGLSKKYNDNSYLRSAVNAIPYIGGSLDILLTSEWNKFHQRRIDDLLSQLSSDLRSVENAIDNDYLRTEEFFDIFYEVVKEASKTRLDNKRKLYSKILRDSITRENETRRTETLLGIISGLNETDLFFLIRIEEFLAVSKIKDYITADGISTYNRKDYEDINEITRVLNKFSFLGLLEYDNKVLVEREIIKYKKTHLYNSIVNYLNE